MNPRALITLVAILILVGLGWYFWQEGPQESRAQNDLAMVRQVVEDFGKRLQDVSLLAPQADVARAMQENYGPYVAPDLLARWQNDPLNAPGRLTSSPWPDRIEVASIEEVSDTEYRVQGSVIEVTNEGGSINEAPTEALRRPITLAVRNTAEGWRITDVTLGAYPGDGAWQYTEPNAQGIQFMYPTTLPTKYISAQEWPPQVSLTTGEEYSCTEQDERMIGDRAYCTVITSEGAAGSTYRTYEYITAQGDFLASVKFILRFPQCANYDEPQRSACATEQTTFDINGLVDRMLSSIRML